MAQQRIEADCSNVQPCYCKYPCCALFYPSLRSFRFVHSLCFSHKLLCLYSHAVSLSLSWNKESNQRKFKAPEKWLKFAPLRYNESAIIQLLLSVLPLLIRAFVQISTLSLLNAPLLKFLNAIFLRPTKSNKIGVQKLGNVVKKGELNHRKRHTHPETSFRLAWRLRWKLSYFYSISSLLRSKLFSSKFNVFKRIAHNG